MLFIFAVRLEQRSRGEELRMNRQSGWLSERAERVFECVRAKKLPMVDCTEGVGWRGAAARIRSRSNFAAR